MAYFIDRNHTPTLSDLAGPGFRQDTDEHYQLCITWFSNEELLDIDGGDDVEAILKARTNLTGQRLERAVMAVLWQAKEIHELKHGIARYGAIGEGRPSPQPHQVPATPAVVLDSVDTDTVNYYDNSSPIPPNFYSQIDKELVHDIEHPPNQPTRPSKAIAIVAPSTPAQRPHQQEPDASSSRRTVDQAIFQLPRRGSSAITIVAPAESSKAPNKPLKPSPLKNEYIPAQEQDDSNQNNTGTSSTEPDQHVINRAFAQTNLALSRDPSSNDLSGMVDTPAASNLYIPPHRSTTSQSQHSTIPATYVPEPVASDNQTDSVQMPHDSSSRPRNHRRPRSHGANEDEAEHAVIMPDTNRPHNAQHRRQNFGHGFQLGRHPGWALDQPDWRS